MVLVSQADVEHLPSQNRLMSQHNCTCLLWGSPNGSASWTLFFSGTLALSAAAASSPLCSSIGPVGAQTAVTRGTVGCVWGEVSPSPLLYLLHLAGSVIVSCHAASFLFDLHRPGLQEAVPDRPLGHISSAVTSDLHLDTNRTNTFPLWLINGVWSIQRRAVSPLNTQAGPEDALVRWIMPGVKIRVYINLLVCRF